MLPHGRASVLVREEIFPIALHGRASLVLFGRFDATNPVMVNRVAEISRNVYV